jgi:sugar-specific transcriptional regulator TrmB
MVDLKEAGLTSNEQKVYIALIELGPSGAGIISRRTGLHRRTVYDTSEMLIKKGLVGYILQNNRRLFQASPPSKIIDSFKEKQVILAPYISELEEKYNEKKEKEGTNFYKGKEGLRTIFEDQLNSKEILILGASPLAYEVFKFYFKWYDKRRKQKKIKTKIIAQDRSIKRIPSAEIKYLPEEYHSPMAINIYGNKTAIILWAKRPMAIVIQNEEITDGYKKYFDLLWKIAKK